MPPSDSARPAEFSIPFPLDEKPTFYDEEAEIAKLKDGRTALAFKAENAVDMETGAIVAVGTAEPRPTRRPSIWGAEGRALKSPRPDQIFDYSYQSDFGDDERALPTHVGTIHSPRSRVPRQPARLDMTRPSLPATKPPRRP
jgi:hypothetical protein